MTKKKLPEVSEKNKKSEILDAYNELLGQIKKEKDQSLQEVKVQKEQVETVKRAASLNEGTISKNILELKLSLTKELDSLAQKMDTEYRKLVDLQNAISIESENIEDLYGIKHSADSLAALLLAQKQQKATFDQEILVTKTAWEREKDAYDQQVKDYKARTKKEWAREEEEYDYTLTLERKKDTDQYEAKKQELEAQLVQQKAQFDKEFVERETALKAQEDELVSLKEQVSSFPEQLEKAVATTQKETKEQIETHYKHQIDLASREHESEQKLNNQTIDTLQAKIKEQEAFIKQLTNKADASTTQVQEIALKAIEGSSSRTHYYAAQHTETTKEKQG